MKTWLITIGLFTAVPVFAQHDTSVQAQMNQGHSPYAGMQGRAIKALSEQQAADLRAGKGMALALPAELNSYPGPGHTLELAEPLGLSEEQKLKTRKLLEQMQVEAKVLGEQLISSEYELDRLFKDKQASLATVQKATEVAARVQGQFRFAHLRYHIAMVAVLTPAQVAKYNELRGYQ